MFKPIIRFVYIIVCLFIAFRPAILKAMTCGVVWWLFQAVSFLIKSLDYYIRQCADNRGNVNVTLIARACISFGRALLLQEAHILLPVSTYPTKKNRKH